MSDGTAAPAWGAYRRGVVFRTLLPLSRGVPRVPVIKQLAFLPRRMERNDSPTHRSLMGRLAGLGYSEALSTPLNLVLLRTAT